jgi:cytochrome P450
MMMTFPTNPIVAATHPNPYPYYAALATENPLYFDLDLGLWVASSAQTVRAVLESTICRVRPVTEPIPKTLLGSPAADIFGHLVRMNDGEYHGSLKGAVTKTVQPIDMANVRQLSLEWTQVLARDLRLHHLSQFAFQLPVFVIGSLLGIPKNSLSQTAQWIDDFVRCLAPVSSSEQIEKGKEAARYLLELMRSVLSNNTSGLLSSLSKHLGHQAITIANGIGFLSQAYEATAGLISNSLLLLARHPDLQATFRNHPAVFIKEVLRYDSPIQNTRRFVAEDGMVANQNMKEGDAILVLLAAANYDLSVNPNPYRFDPFRKELHLFTLGLGKHACPGEILAATITQATLEYLTEYIDLTSLHTSVSYRPSANTRIPQFR